MELYFPRSLTKEAQAEASERVNAIVGGDETILVVEDEPLVRQYLNNQVQGLGYRIFVVASGPEASALMNETRKFDLLFTDIVLPDGMNGVQIAAAILKIRPEVKVLFTSGYTEMSTHGQEGLDADVELLTKPHQREQMAARVRKVLDRR